MKKPATNTSTVRAKNKRAGKVLLQGELTLLNSLAIKHKLVNAMQRNQELKVVLQKVTAIDLSFLQLLCGLARTSRVLKKRIVFDFHLSEEVESLLGKTGFRSLLEKESSN